MSFEEEFLHHIVDKVNANLKRNRVVGFGFRMTWSDRVSNSHDCPVGGVTNWWSKNDLPKGYPGWRGRVWVRYNKPFSGFGSDPFDYTCFHTGTGGFGSYDGPWSDISSLVFKHRPNFLKKEYVELEPQIYSWDCCAFADDFPEFRDAYTELQVVRALKGINYPEHPVIEYYWDDPEFEEFDAKLRERFSKVESEQVRQVV